MKKPFFSNLAFRYFFEIVVIVFSITISFSLQNYQIKKLNNTLKNRYLKRMLNDLKQDSILIKDAIYTTHQRMKLNDQFISGEITGESLSGFVGYYGLNFNDKSYESFSDLSLLNAIDDDNLFNLMTNYYKKHYEQVKDMEEEERLLTIELRNYIFSLDKLMRNEIKTKLSDIKISEWVSDIDGLNDIEVSLYEWEKKPFNIGKFENNNYLSNQVRYLKSIRDWYIVQLKILLDSNSRLMGKISSELNLN